MHGAPSLGDPAYLTPPGRTLGVLPPMPAIVYPRMGWPELLPWGGELELWLDGHGEGGEASSAPAAYRVEIADDVRTADGPTFRLRLDGVRWDAVHGVRVLTARVPIEAARGTYDLVVTAPGITRAVAPHAVRIYGRESGAFHFAFMADHQLWDPSWRAEAIEKNQGDYPRHGEVDENRAITRQELAELALLDPDFVLDGGDLVFGLDPPDEYREMANLWRDLRLATFIVPGNHDGYAQYHLHFNAAAVPRALAAIALCTPRLGAIKGLADLGHVGFARLADFLVCAYGDVTPVLFTHPSYDGLDLFRRRFGPTSYSFDRGPLHVIGLNSYGGSPERRHAFSIWIDAFDLHLGAPAVDNYGGYLDDRQLAWVEADAARADAAGKTVLLFEHQDPRGNLARAEHYAEDHPFPTDPLSLRGFEEWNYDDAWASDPAGARPESASQNSGTRLLGTIARHVTCVLTGHIHGDEETALPAGATLPGGATLAHAVEFLRVTTAASSTHGPGDYWGYRLLGVFADGRLDTSPFDGDEGLASLPAGNFWAGPQRLRPDGATEIQVTNGLPRPLSLLLRFTLPRLPAGYRFAEDGAEELPVEDVLPWRDGRTATYLVPVAVAARPGHFPPGPGPRTLVSIVARPIAASAAPTVAIAIARSSAPSSAPALGGLSVAATEASATSSTGDRFVTGAALHLGARALGTAALATLSWRVKGVDGEESAARGEAIDVAADRPGNVTVELQAVDLHGALLVAERTIALVSPPASAPRSTSEGAASALASGSATSGAAAIGRLRTAPPSDGCACRTLPVALEDPKAAALWLLVLFLLAAAGRFFARQRGR